jgi:hypothetical protein
VRLVRTGEDYANWALEILVKFRDEEELQVLTGQRQSGGVSAKGPRIRAMTLTVSIPPGTFTYHDHVLDEFD